MSSGMYRHAPEAEQAATAAERVAVRRAQRVRTSIGLERTCHEVISAAKGLHPRAATDAARRAAGNELA